MRLGAVQPTHVALLRGVNVGRARRIAMADLRALMEALGFAAVSTLAASGNVVYAAADKDDSDHGARIAAAMAKELDVTAPVFVLRVAELAAALATNPLHTVARDPARLLVAVAATPSARVNLAALAGEQWAPDALALGKRVGYLWCARGVSQSKLFETVNRKLGDAVTTRNWATLEKLLALATRPA